MDIYSLSTGEYLDTLPEGFTILTEPRPPQRETTCAQQISALVESLKDLVTAVSVNAGSSVPALFPGTRQQAGVSACGDGLLTPDDASEYLRIPKTALNRECRNRAVAYVTINHRGDRRFRKEDLDTYLEKKRVAARAVARAYGKGVKAEKQAGGGETTVGRIKQDRDLTDLRKEIQKLWQ